MKHQFLLFKPFLSFLLCGILSCSSSAFAEEQENKCLRPETTPAVPDGRRASEQEMKSAMTEVREYLDANSAFRECIRKLLKKSNESTSEAVLQAAMRLIEETQETDELLGDLFNQQVRVYKSVNPAF